MPDLKPFEQILANQRQPLGSQAEPERRQLTVMFCDLVGYTALSRQLDPEELHALIRAYQSTCAAVIAQYDGCVARYMGDGIMIHFGYPRAYEDDVERAVSAGLGIVEAMADLNVRLAREDDIELSVRIGIATGEVIIGDLIGEGVSEEQAVVGQTPNLAARLQGVAAPNTVVIDSASKNLLGDLFQYHGLGPQELKGFDKPIWAWQVLGPSACVESRFDAMRADSLAPLVGCEQETETLFQHWQLAQAGQGQVVLLQGPAGIGKSRLLRTLCEAIDKDASDKNASDKNAPRPACYQCSSHNAYGTLRAFLRKLEWIDELREQPQPIIIEDLQWLNPSELALLNRLIKRARQRRVLVLITSRAMFRSHWLSQSHVSLLTLQPLNRAQSRAMVKGITAEHSMPEPLIDGIVNKSDGVPLFIEEVTKSVLACGQLDSEKPGCPLGDSLPLQQMPARLHNLLMACLDPLPMFTKRVVQIAAVIGRVFSHTLVAKVAEAMNIDVNRAVDQLLRLGLIIPQQMGNQRNYEFKHALVKEIICASLLKQQRRQLQAYVAQAKQQAWNSRETHIEMVA